VRQLLYIVNWFVGSGSITTYDWMRYTGAGCGCCSSW